jgi:hypothetical protein
MTNYVAAWILTVFSPELHGPRHAIQFIWKSIVNVSRAMRKLSYIRARRLDSFPIADQPPTIGRGTSVLLAFYGQVTFFLTPPGA